MEILENGIELIAIIVEQAERRWSGRGWNIKLNHVGSTCFLFHELVIRSANTPIELFCKNIYIISRLMLPSMIPTMFHIKEG